MVKKLALGFMAIAFLSATSMPVHAYDPMGSSLLKNSKDIILVKKKKASSSNYDPSGVMLVKKKAKKTSSATYDSSGIILVKAKKKK